MDFLGVSLIVVPKGEDPAITIWNDSRDERDLTKVYEDSANDVYRNTAAYPRFALYYGVRDGVSDTDALKLLAAPPFDLKNTLILQEKLPAPLQTGTGSATLLSSGINSLSFTTVTNKPALLYLSDAYDNGWHASVNGERCPFFMRIMTSVRF